jgi:biopolymer transport protein ExbD
MAVHLPGDDDDGAIVAEINITPLTDVFLVLLIIFMVTSSVIANTGKKVELPSAQQTSSTPPKAVNLTLAADGSVQVEGDVVRRDAVLDALKAALDKTEERQVILRGDGVIPYADAVWALDQAQLAGAKGFALATTKKRGEE